MILLVFLSLASFSGCDKLDRTYLPPPGSKFAGGSPGAISAPAEQPTLDQTIEGTTIRPQTSSSVFYSPTTGDLGQSNVQPGIGYQTSNVNILPGSTIPGTYNVPTTTTSYAFTQTTTYAPITCINPDCAIETASPTQFSSSPNLIQQGFPQQVSNLQQSVIRPSTNQPDTFVSQQGRLPKIPFQQVTSQYLPSNLPGYQQQQYSKLQPGSNSGTVDGLTQQPIQTYFAGKIPQGSSEYTQRPAQKNAIPTQTNVYNPTNLPSFESQTPITYNRPDTAQKNLSGTSSLPVFKESLSTPSIFNRIPSNRVQDFRSYNISNIPGYGTSTSLPFVGQKGIDTLQTPSKSAQFSSQPSFDNSNLKTLIPTSDSNIPSLKYPTSTLPSGYSPTATPDQFDKSVYDTPSELQPNDQFSGIGRPVIPGSGLIERRPVRPQAEFERNAAILKYENIVTPEGFAYSFDTENGIHADESGTAVDGVKAQGAFSYTGDDGKLYSIVYSADENGYQPIGDHLPTSPPIPEEILRVIQQSNLDKEAGISDDGSYDDKKYGYQKYQGAMDRYVPNEYRKYSPSVPIRGQYDGSYEKVEKGDYIDDVVPDDDKSYKQSGTFKQSLPNISDKFSPDRYRQKIRPAISNQEFDQQQGRLPSDLQKPELTKYNNNRKLIDDLRYTDSEPTRFPNQQQQGINRKVGSNIIQGNKPEVQYNNEYYGPDEQDGNVRRPLRPQINNGKIINVNSRVTPESFTTGYTPTTFRPITKEKYLTRKDDKEEQFSDDVDQNYEYQDVEEKNKLNTKPGFRRPSIQVKKPLNVNGYTYLPPSQIFETTAGTRLQNGFKEQTQFPSTASTREPTGGQIKLTTLRPFMTPNASPPRTSLDDDSDENFSTTYPTSGPSQAKIYSGNIPIYKSTNYTKTSEKPLLNQNEQALSGRPTLVNDYTPGSERQYQGYDTSERTDKPNEYKQYTTPQEYFQKTQPKASKIPTTSFSGGRNQNLRRPIDRFSQKDILGQSPQSVFPQKIDAAIKPQYYTTQTPKQYQKQYTNPIEYSETDTTLPAQEIRSGTAVPKYYPTKSQTESQKDYPQQPQYIQSVTQTEDVPTTYRPSIENFDSSTASPSYTIPPTKSFGLSRTAPGQRVTQNQVFASQPTSDGTGSIEVRPGLSTTYPIASEDESRPDGSYGKDVSSAYVTDRPSSVTVYQLEEGRKPGGSDVSDIRLDYTKPVSGLTQFQNIKDSKLQDKVEGNPIYEQDRPVFGQGDRFNPSQTIKGETFTGPKQPPRFDPETGYYY